MPQSGTTVLDSDLGTAIGGNVSATSIFTLDFTDLDAI
jgi:hypothetical protein